MKKILTRKEYLSELTEKYYTSHTGYSVINEEAPMANDIPWGDSLVGRLINSFARKSKIAFNKRRISGLVTGLKALFEEMLITGTIQMPENNLRKIETSNLLGILVEQVESGEDVNVLIDTSNKIREKVIDWNPDNKDVMIKAIDDFLEYLRGLKTGNTEDEGETSEEGESQDPNKIFYQNSRNLLQSVVDLHMMITQNVVRIGGGQESYDNKLASAKSKLKVGNEYNYLNSKGVTIRCMLLSLTNEIQRAADKKWLTEDDVVGRKLEPDQACVVYKKDKDGKDAKDYNSVYSSQVVEILKIYSLDGKMPGKIEKPGENLSTNFNKDKYSDLEKKYLSSKKYEILKNLIKMGGQGIKIYTAKKDNQNSKFYTDKTNNYISILVKMQAKSYGISTEETKDFKQPDGTIKKKPTGKHKDINTLKDEIRNASKEVWSVDLPLGKSSGKVSQPPTGVAATTMQKASYNIETGFDSILEEVEANLQNEESQAKNSWKKIVNSYNQSKVSSLIPEIEKLLKVSIKDGKDEYKKAKSLIVSICKQVVLNKSTVGKPISFEDLVKEDLNINDTSKSISLMGRVILSLKEDMGLVGSFGSAIKPLKSFITSFDELEKNISKISTEKKESLHRYTDFSIILERNEFSEDIKNKFDEIFTDEIKAYFEIQNDEVEEIKNSAKETPGGELLFTTSDPIIEIVRLFHRANRIHTPGVIPSGRTGGKVSNSVFREYEDLGAGGGTPDSPGRGPYRNIELYDSWFNAVQDILSDTKYRPIFSEKTVFQFKNEETGGEGDKIEKGGKILLRFINNLLSDSKMYNGGAINTFIEEYFKLKGGIPTTKQVLPGHKNDADENENNSDGVVVTEVKYVKSSPAGSIRDINTDDLYKLFTGSDEVENLAFRLVGKTDEGKDFQWYCVFKEYINQYPVFIFSLNNLPCDLSKISGIPKSSIPTTAYLASLPKFTGANHRLKVGEKIAIRMVDLKTPQQEKVNSGKGRDRIEISITKLEVLCNKDSEKYLGLSKYSPNLKSIISTGYDAAKNLVTRK
jgi:hypothetical protein